MKTLLCVLFTALSLFAQQPKPSAFQKLLFAPWPVMEGSDMYYIPMGYGVATAAQITQAKTNFEDIMDRKILEAQVMVSHEGSSYGPVRTGIIVKTKKKGGG